MRKPEIAIAIADDHRAIRQALVHAFSQFSFITILYEAQNGNELISKLSVRQPDVVLLDIKMPELNGIEVLKIIHQKYPAVRTLILSAFFDEVYVAECLQYGINGFLTKNMDIHEIVQAIEKAHNNEMYVTNLLANTYFKNYVLKHKKTVHALLPEFSEEEIRMVELMKEEKTTDEISRIMCMSKRSIEMKRDKMKQKAHVKTIGGLLLYSLKRGFIE